MKNYNIQERFFIFLGIVVLSLAFYNHYFHFKIEQEIRVAMEKNNSITRQYHLDSIARDLAIDHWKSMYNAQKFQAESLEQQINVVSDYWKKEYIKVSDKLFDLKYSTTNKLTNPKNEP